jgi:geranylgeranylglycerol-phosphate geranylgeranyltransferase
LIFMPKIHAFLKLIRPLNVTIAGISVVIGAAVAGQVIFWWKILFAVISAGTIVGAGNAINDYFDLEIDRINKPQRPLPQGEIHPRDTVLFSAFLFLVGINLSIFISPIALVISILASSSLIAYSWSLKRKLLIGNLTVAFVSSLAFVYGGITTKDYRLSLIPAVLSFFFHLGREILKDLEDFKGDVTCGARTLAIVKGERFTLTTVSAVFGLLAILVFIPFMLGLFSVAYLIVAFFGVVLILFYVVYSMWKDSSVRNLGRLSIILKVSMCFGLLALILGKL